MLDFIFETSLFWSVLIICTLAAALMSPLVIYYRVRDIRQSRRNETIAARAEALIKGSGSLDFTITGKTKPSAQLKFDNDSIRFQGKTYSWKILRNKIQSWRVFDQNNPHNEFTASIPPSWNCEFLDSKNRYCFDGGFLQDSESRPLVIAAAVRLELPGTDESYPLEALQREIARSERLLNQVSDGNN